MSIRAEAIGNRDEKKTRSEPGVGRALKREQRVSTQNVDVCLRVHLERSLLGRLKAEYVARWQRRTGMRYRRVPIQQPVREAP